MTGDVTTKLSTTAPQTNSTARRAFFITTAIIVFAWLVLVVAWHDAPFALTFDDAWYYFAIGRNVAEGHGSTFDGINLTNGYHPLWLIISVVPFRIGLDDLDAARAILVVQLLVGFGVTFALVGGMFARLLRTWPPEGKAGRRPGANRLGVITVAAAFGVMAGSPFILKVFVNGLESGITATCDAALLYLAVRHGGRWTTVGSSWSRLGIGTLLAATFLARTDAVLLFACLGLWCVAELIRDRPPRPVLRLVEHFAIPTLVLVAYLAFNQRVFGTPVQVSGLIKRAPTSVANIALFACFVAIAAWIGWRAFRGPGGTGRFPVASTFVVRTGWFAPFCVLLIGYYNVLQVQQWLWYYAPAVLYGICLWTLAIADMAGASLRDAPAGASAERALAPVQLIAGFVLVGLLAFTAPQFFDPNLRSIQVANADTGVWMRDNLPPDARIASWDAGALGYFSHRHVLNLDGVVNSYEYSQDGSVLTRQMCEVPSAFVANHGGNIDGEDPDVRAYIRAAFGEQPERDATIVHTRPFTYSGVLSSTAGNSSVGAAELAVHVYRLPTLDPAITNC